ncbi:hypothetical protein [Paraburkholderia oxyphila]|uniref:hypothetical protein n=1 Tax=Paraburkholderia oxyphila TaxID=614212 RepID=UPI0012ECCB1C|nr:hypothetical protein [Paraburkholderia oxyphila]
MIEIHGRSMGQVVDPMRIAGARIAADVQRNAACPAGILAGVRVSAFYPTGRWANWTPGRQATNVFAALSAALL